jgi:hypothetical protein
MRGKEEILPDLQAREEVSRPARNTPTDACVSGSTGERGGDGRSPPKSEAGVGRRGAERRWRPGRSGRVLVTL